jgi:hypothetical protein
MSNDSVILAIEDKGGVAAIPAGVMQPLDSSA